MKNEFDLRVQNIVAFTALGKTIPLQRLLDTVENTEWHPEKFPGLIYRIKEPKSAALIFPQGKIVCTGTKSLEELETAMQKIVGRIGEAGIETPDKFSTKVENIVAISKIRASLNLEEIAIALENSEFEPESFPGLVYRVNDPRVAFLLFTSGRIVCAGARNVESIQKALHVFKGHLEGIGIDVVPEK
ncbi:MAG: TATA-box-binding protein [Candidatus Aenigmarchaeota archaeon]|nr:TATA-box-binding protein [Candidatus Aenigmarchaeota archaeon]